MKNRIHQMNGVIEANLINISSKNWIITQHSWQDEEETLKDFLFQSANDLEKSVSSIKRELSKWSFPKKGALSHWEKSSIFFNGSPWGGSPQPQKQKLTVIRKNIFDFDPCLSLVDTRFVLLFLEFTKKDILRVSTSDWKFDYSPSGKPLLKILAARWFLLWWGLLLKKTQTKRVHSCFCLFSGLREILTSPRISKCGYILYIQSELAYLIFFF